MRRWLSALIVFLLPLAASAQVSDEAVVLGLSQNRVAITANFDGSEILVFGAVKRETPIDTQTDLDVIITVQGPSEPVVVRRKERKFGIWINTDSVEIDLAPSFYAAATNAPFEKILSQTEDLRHRISVPLAIRSVGAPAEVENAQSFSEAVVRIRTDNGLYSVRENTIDVSEQTLFRTSIAMPSNLTEGSYETRVFLLRDQAVVSSYSTTIDVRKVGLEKFLFSLSREQPLVYGILSLAIAIIAGWGASAIFTLIRQN